MAEQSEKLTLNNTYLSCTIHEDEVLLRLLCALAPFFHGAELEAKVQETEIAYSKLRASSMYEGY